MRTVFYILLAVFILFSIMHLVFCFQEKEKERKITKPFCLLILGVAAVLMAPNYPLIYIGAFLGMLGDILLIFKKNIKCFLVGTALFISGHFLYYTQAILHMKDVCGIVVPWYVFLIVFAILVVLTFVLYPFTKGLAGKATLAGNFYMQFLVVLVATGIFLAIYLNKSGQSPLGGILMAVGYVFFLASDSILIYTTYVKDIKRRDFPIMITYLAAELCIVFGLISVIANI